MSALPGNKGQLLPNSSEFNVDPNAPFLGGGVNPSSYEPSSPPARPSQFQRLASLKRFVSYTRPTRQTHPEDGNSDTTIDSPTPTPTSILPSSPPDPIRPFWSEHAPQPVQQPQYASSPVISPHTVLSPAGYPRYSPAQAPYNANNLRTPSSGHQSESTRNSYEETVPEQDLEDTLINHDSQFQPNATAPADMFEQSAVHIAADYAKMPEPPYPPHGTGRPSRMQTFWETLNNMPWVSKEGRITVDYLPRRTRRPDVSIRDSQDPTTQYYSPPPPVNSAPDIMITPFPAPPGGLPTAQMQYLPVADHGVSLGPQYPNGYSYQPPGQAYVVPGSASMSSGSDTGQLHRFPADMVNAYPAYPTA